MTKIIGRALLMALAVFALPVVVSGCTTISRYFGQEQAATYDEKALITAELAYSFVLQTVTVASNSGALTAEQATAVRPHLVSVNDAIVRARTAYAAGNELDAGIATRDVTAQVVALTTLLEQFGVLERGELR